VAIVLAIAGSTAAFADERPGPAAAADTAVAAALGTSPLITLDDSSTDANERSFSVPKRPIFDAASRAAQVPAATTTGTNEHQFGAGVRLGTLGDSIGASVRYFFYAGPLGVQGEITRTGYDIDVGPFDVDWSSVQFAPSAIYRFREHQFEGPVSLTPYAGAGLTFLHFDLDDDFFDEDEDDTEVGLLLYGGVELFFQNIPNLGVSGELTFTSNDDVGPTSIDRVRFTAAGHWYFW
jgi:hypothetical protein